MELFGKEPRPTKPDIDEVATVISKEIIKWANDGSTMEEVKPEIIDMIENNHDEDGFALAKYMENYKGYDADSGLVEILDDVEYVKYSLLDKKLREWVKQNDIQPKFEEGKEVKVILQNPKTYKKEERIGKIANIQKDTAKYAVHVPGVSKNDDSAYLFAFEEIEKLNQ